MMKARPGAGDAVSWRAVCGGEGMGIVVHMDFTARHLQEENQSTLSPEVVFQAQPQFEWHYCLANVSIKYSN